LRCESLFDQVGQAWTKAGHNPQRFDEIIHKRTRAKRVLYIILNYWMSDVPDIELRAKASGDAFDNDHRPLQ
jgi:hypothetical protein